MLRGALLNIPAMWAVYAILQLCVNMFHLLLFWPSHVCELDQNHVVLQKQF